MKRSVALCLITAAIWTSLATDLNAAKILLVPMNCNSHLIYFARLGIDLAKLGHVVTLLAPSGARVPNFVSDNTANFAYIKYPVDRVTPFYNSPEMSQKLIAMAMNKWSLLYMSLLREFHLHGLRDGEQECTRLLDNVELMRQVRESNFDFAIMDPASAISCYYTIPLSLGIPYASLSVPLFTPLLFRVPRHSAFPHPLMPFERPTFSQRLQAFILERSDFGLSDGETHFMQKYAPNRPYLNAVEMVQNQSLWFFLEDLSINFPMPQMPNTVAVGDIMAETEERPLSGEIKEFVSRSKRGVILVVFGSFCDFFPPTITEPLCEALTESTQRFGLSVIWKLNDKSFCRNDNVFISPWIPQNDLLADPRVQIFISHGGYNSIVESVYHAKPLIIMPLGLDQPANAAFAESKGYAIRMNIVDFSPQSLVSNVDKLLTDPTYKRAAQLASAILRDRRDTPAQRVSAMIDHVIKYGDRHLRSGALELSTLQFMMFDIFAALVAVAAVVLSCVSVCCYCVYLSCCRRCCHGETYREKSKSQ